MLSKTGKLDDSRPCAEHPTPGQQAESRGRADDQAYAPEFADSSSKQIVPQLADNRRPFYPLPIRLARTEDRGSISVNSLMGEGVKPQLV